MVCTVFCNDGVVSGFRCFRRFFRTSTEINSEPSDDETADVIKKIILNFLQMVALAGGLPLRWPKAVENMFLSFSTVSSAGTTLMIPDCELSTMKTSDAFYYKQIAFRRDGEQIV